MLLFLLQCFLSFATTVKSCLLSCLTGSSAPSFLTFFFNAASVGYYAPTNSCAGQRPNYALRHVVNLAALDFASRPTKGLGLWGYGGAFIGRGRGKDGSWEEGTTNILTGALNGWAEELEWRDGWGTERRFNWGLFIIFFCYFLILFSQLVFFLPASPQYTHISTTILI